MSINKYWMVQFKSVNNYWCDRTDTIELTRKASIDKWLHDTNDWSSSHWRKKQRGGDVRCVKVILVPSDEIEIITLRASARSPPP